MNRVCEGWNDTSNQKFMNAFQKDAKQIDEIANRMVEYAKFIGKSSEILEMYRSIRI